LSNFRFEAKQSEAKFKSIFSFFFTFFAIFRIFRIFSFFFALNVSLHFEAKQSEAKFKSIFRFFAFFPPFFAFFRFFSLTFRLFYLHFRFRFLVFHIEVNHVISGFFFASKPNKIFASISNFASEAKVRAHPSPKARGLAQHDPGGVVLYVMDGPYRLPFPHRTSCTDRSCSAAR
jgi:hypothetical protein